MICCILTAAGSKQDNYCTVRKKDLETPYKQIYMETQYTLSF